MTGPYKDLPSHGIAYDTWAGLVHARGRRRRLHRHPRAPVDRHPRRAAVRRPRHPRRHHPGPGDRRGLPARDRPVRRRRRHGLAAQRDVEGLRAPRGRGHRQQGRRLRAPRARHRRHARRRALPDLRDRRTATCCSWRRSRSSGRTSARRRPRRPVRAHPGSQYADHARGNRELRAELRDDLPQPARRAEWIAFGDERNTPIAPVNTPKTLADDPQFQDRLPWIAAERARRRAAARRRSRSSATSCPAPTKAPTRRRAHRRRPARRARLRRRPHRRAAGRGRPRLTALLRRVPAGCALASLPSVRCDDEW